MKILVTGHLGLVGSNLTKRLLKEKHEVHEIIVDLRDKRLVDYWMEKIKPDVVYHLAANAAESRGQISPIEMTENNLMIFLNVLKAAINSKVKRFIYTSSVAVYGEAITPYREDGPTRPKDVYGVNKLAAEQILKIMAKVYGFEYVIFRPHNIYGPGQNMADPYRNVVALFMRRLIEGQPYKLYGEGKMCRAFSYVDDVVDVLVSALGDKFANQTLNVGSDNAISIKELSDALQLLTGLRTEVEMVPARPQEISMFLADHSLQNSLTTYRETPIELGLKKTWEWVNAQPLPELKKKEDEINVHPS